MNPMRLIGPCVCLSAVLVLAGVAAGQEEKSATGPQDVLVDPAAQKAYDDKAAKLADTDVKGWLALAGYCETQLLFGRRESALRKAVSASADNPEAHRRLDEVKVDKEWLSCAEADADEAKKHQANGEVFYGKTWMTAKSATRPCAADRRRFGWEVQTRVDGRTCIVLSAASYEETRAVADVIDAVTAGYGVMYGKVRRLNLSKPLVVHLFNSPDVLRAEFARMGKTPTEPPAGFAGAFSPVSKMLFVSTDIGSPAWNRDTLLHTVAHETTHALDELGAGMALNDMPAWIGEGRARYAQYALVGRQWLPGALNIGGTDAEGQALEKAYKTASLETLLGLDVRTFVANHAVNYPVAWSFTHFLLHADEGKYRTRYLRFLSGCPKNGSAADFHKIVAGPADLEGPWRNYVETVFLPALKASVNADRKARGLAGEWN